MNVLSIYPNYYTTVGGVQSVIRNISEYLVRKNHKVSVLCFSDSPQLTKEIINGVTVYRIYDVYASKLFNYSIKFNEFYRNNVNLFAEVDIIHIHGYSSVLSWQTIRFLANKGFSEKIIFNPHYEGRIGSSPMNKFLHQFYRKFSGSSFFYPKKIICVSEFEKNKIVHDFGINKEKIKVIANGISYNVSDSKIFKKISPEKIQLLYVGRIIQKKGINYILEALKALEKECDYNYVFYIIGEGPYRNHLEYMVNTMNLHNIHFLGCVHDSELKNILMRSDIFLLLSESEAYGIVVAEALANNVFSIVSRTTALAEFCSEPGCFCIDFPPKTEAIVNIIKQLVKNGGNIGPFNPNKIRNWNIAASEYEDEYNNLIHKKM